MSPLTGWFRDGYCNTDKYDVGVHVICGTMTEDVSAKINNKYWDIAVGLRGRQGVFIFRFGCRGRYRYRK